MISIESIAPMLAQSAQLIGDRGLIAVGAGIGAGLATIGGGFSPDSIEPFDQQFVLPVVIVGN